MSSPSPRASLSYEKPSIHSGGRRDWSTAAAYHLKDRVASSDSEMQDYKLMHQMAMHKAEAERMLSSAHSDTNTHSRMSSQTAAPSAPLVLLHVSVLPSSFPDYPREILEQNAPAWVVDNYLVLRDKLSEAVLARGVLVPHPGEEYDLLEEHLLEALELITPRVSSDGHFLPPDTPDTEREVRFICGPDDHDHEEAEQDICETCESSIHLPNRGVGEGSRRWDVRFFAANGLMRAGAWSAAWKEMERVDVEVGLWLPEDVKRKVGRAWEAEEELQRHMHMEREREQRAEMIKLVKEKEVVKPVEVKVEKREELADLLKAWAEDILRDGKNVALAGLMLLVVLMCLFSVGRSPPQVIIREATPPMHQYSMAFSMPAAHTVSHPSIVSQKAVSTTIEAQLPSAPAAQIVKEVEMSSIAASEKKVTVSESGVVITSNKDVDSNIALKEL
jgi:hypothetical protein